MMGRCIFKRQPHTKPATEDTKSTRSGVHEIRHGILLEYHLIYGMRELQSMDKFATNKTE